MNREQQLQKEIEKYKRYEKIARRATLFFLSIAAILFVASLVYRPTVKAKQPAQRKTPLICPDCDSIPDVTYQYDSITSGSLPFDPITKKKGVIIQSDTL